MALLHLHLGAHKTGSTFLQKTFLANRPNLEAAGISYISLAESRSLVLPAVQGRSASPQAAHDCRELLAAGWSRRDAVLLSDENLLGSLYRFSAGRGLYPSSQANLRSLFNILGEDVEVVLYLSVRSYSAWLQSAYLQMLKRKRLVAFADFVKTAHLAVLSWVGLVERLARAVPRARIVLWSYELFANDNAGVVSWLSEKMGGVDLRAVEARPNPSLSAIAHEVLMTCGRAGINESDIQSLLKYLQAHLSVAKGYAKPVLLGPDEISALDRRYEADLRQLRQLPGVDMFGLD